MTETLPTSIRFKPQDLQEIDQRASTHGLSRATYITRCALGTLEADESVLAAELNQIRERLERLEQTAFGY